MKHTIIERSGMRGITGGLLLVVFLLSAFNSYATGQQEIKEESRLVMIINYPYQIWSTDPTKIHVTLFKPDFSPAGKAEVKVNGKVVGRSDKNGVCIFDYVPGDKESHHLEAVLVEGGVRYREEKLFSCGSRTASFKAERLYVYTDRGVYNPGQKVYVRMIAWSLAGEYTAIPDADIQLLFRDTSGNVYNGEYVRTGDDGIAWTEFSLPPHMREGDYELVVLYGKARESARIRVKRFVPPIISIKHDLKRYLTDTQTRLDVHVELGYFSGGRLSSSKLSMIVEDEKKTVVFSRTFESGKPDYEVTLGKTELDEIRRGLEVESYFTIKLGVIDSYGQSDEVVWDVLYTARPYSAVIELDKDAYPAGETVQLLAKVVDIDRQPAAGIELVLNVGEIGVNLTSKTDEKGLARFEFVMPSSSVTAVLSSPIMKPALGERAVPFQEKKPMSSKVAELPKKAGMKTEITVYFDPSYIPIEKVVHVDLTDISGALVQATTIPVKKRGNEYYAEGEVAAPTWGSMLANLYCCAVEKEQSGKPYTRGNVGFITEGQHITFYPDRELEIVIENFKPQSAPGEKAVFRITVKGGKGEKSLGVSVVDDAVISLLDPFIVPPVGHFYNPQAKVIATGGAGVLTWPVVDRNWGSPWRDIAYSNWGWKAPGSAVASQFGADELEKAAPPSKADAGGYMEEGMESKSMMLEESIDMAEKEDMIAESMEAGDDETTNGDTSKRRDADDSPGEAKAGGTIIIRTSFPETALWEPSLATKNGKATVSVRIPDEITTQNLTIVATDRQGYIGMLRKEISVRQPVFIRSAFPPAMTRGDRLTVHAQLRNLTDSALACKAKLSPDGFSVIGDDEHTCVIPPYSNCLAEWTVSASSCGEKTYVVSVNTGTYGDAEKKKIMVLPDGIPDTSVTKAVIGRAMPFEHRFSIDRDAVYYTASVNVSLPNVFPAFQAWYAFDIHPWYSPWTVAATAIANAAMLDYVRVMDRNAEKEALLVNKLKDALLVLVNNQLQSGGWGWYAVSGNGRGQEDKESAGLYYTVACLRALMDIRNAGLNVESAVLDKAVQYILARRGNDGLWSSRGAYFWEVFNEKTDYALSAEIFEVLCFALTGMADPYRVESDVRELKETMTNVLEERPDEPMTAAAAIQGLLYWRRFAQDTSVDHIIQKGIKHLISLKRTGYWEPHWYHAYGGMVELNARILSLLAAFDPASYKGFLREGITWLLSTREAWGAWHNEIGTAQAIRALLETGAFAEEEEGTIVLTVNGREAAKVKVDPDDPFLSAAALGYVDISPWIVPGENRVTAGYSGKLEASVIVEVKVWGGRVKTDDGNVGVVRSAAEEAVIGQPVRVKLSLETKTPIPAVLIEEALPSNCTVMETSLEKLLADHRITGYRVSGGKLYLSLVSVAGQFELTYMLTPVRKGSAVHGGTILRDSASGRLLAVFSRGKLSVK
ncbi:MAG: hypothetical protein JW881_02645 [Spirochaetales bacterium]|nr:hypothetical protein [Spirochaetales bacterium]